jgi:glycosyltransferase involved in cell wall biosynthesis
MLSNSAAEIDRLTVHWVSPLPPLPTDIAHYTRRILPSLAKVADVVLWTSQDEWDAEINTYATVRRFDAFAKHPMDLFGIESARNEINAAFFNIGNSYTFHRDIFCLSQRVPGIVVIHDLVLQEFFRDMLHNKVLDPTAYVRAMHRHYGDEAARIARDVCTTMKLSADILERYPMFEAVIEKSVAALVHTPTGMDSIGSRGLVPAYHLDLPFAISQLSSAGRAATGPLRLLQFGHIGPNRRLLQVLDALGEIKDTLEFSFEICGAVWDAELVERAIERLGLSSRVRMRGFVPEHELDAAIAEAHLVFNLRFPSMGEASGSQLRIWNQAALSVVSQVGWYATLPDDCVIKISIENERRELIDLLRLLDADRTRFVARAVAGRANVERRHSSHAYAAGILEISRNFRHDVRDRLLIDACVPTIRSFSEGSAQELVRASVARGIS